jgi:polysaccharide export outer membrane protein
MKNNIKWCLLAGVLGCSTACTLQPIVPPPVMNGPAAAVQTWEPAAGYDAAAYRISSLDPLTIQFTGLPEQQTTQQLIVDEAGRINLPHIGPIKAAGMTTSELEREIERLYKEGQIYRNISINVIMTAKSYYIQGEVSSPGQFPLTSGTTLLQAIAAARGVSPFASDKVTLTRKGRIFKYNIGEIKRHPDRDVKIEAGDLINVHRSWI